MMHTAAWWAGRISELEASGDAQAVARRHGVKVSTLKWWRTELRRRARASASPRLLPVVVKAEAPAPNHAPAQGLEVLVEVGTTRMTLRGEMSAEHLAVLVKALARSC
ncbi:MAG: hypothetical protein FWD73_17870, partial [Polyangiaceae bacterium]|nr:hypothetical protein [Polyangiaceae bacterium]